MERLVIVVHCCLFVSVDWILNDYWIWMLESLFGCWRLHPSLFAAAGLGSVSMGHSPSMAMAMHAGCPRLVAWLWTALSLWQVLRLGSGASVNRLVRVGSAIGILGSMQIASSTSMVWCNRCVARDIAVSLDWRRRYFRARWHLWYRWHLDFYCRRLSYDSLLSLAYFRLIFLSFFSVGPWHFIRH